MSVDKTVAESSDHALACVLYGDCIYDEVQLGAREIEKAWKGRTGSWDSLVDKAVKQGFLGWGSPLVDRKWLMQALLSGSRAWPSGLSPREEKLLELAVAVTGYHRLYSKGVKIDRSKGEHLDPTKAESDEKTLKALKKFAALFEKHIADPMWKDYEQVASKYGRMIQPLCEKRYGESCNLSESKDIFKGDLQRGLKAKTLDMDPPTYRVLPRFLRWIAA